MTDHAQGDMTATMRKREYETSVDEQGRLAFSRKGALSDIGRATIFDLTLQDRRRVAEMISELASTTERIEILETRLEAVGENDEKYKQKCSKLMKKVDALTEKVQHLESERAQVKLKHCKNLETLQATVSNISKQFEKSMEDMEVLRKNYDILEKENKRLREELNQASCILTTALNERSEIGCKARGSSRTVESNQATRNVVESTIQYSPNSTQESRRRSDVEDELVEKVFFRF